MIMYIHVHAFGTLLSAKECFAIELEHTDLHTIRLTCNNLCVCFMFAHM